MAPWLNFKTSYAYRGVHYRYALHYPDYISNGQNPYNYPYQQEDTYYWEEQVIDNVLTFNKEFGKHSLNVMAGSSITSTKYTENGVNVTGKTTKYYVDQMVISQTARNLPVSSIRVSALSMQVSAVLLQVTATTINTTVPLSSAA